jgi:hypothetical protein
MIGMPRQCTICTHKQRDEINAALLSGAPYRSIAKRFAASEAAVFRHKQDHLPSTLVKAQEAQEIAHADNLLDQIHVYQKRVDGITEKAEAGGDYRTALQGLREARGYLELLAKVVGEIDDRPQVNVMIDARVQQVILDALAPHPEARYAVAEALKGIDRGDAA